MTKKAVLTGINRYKHISNLRGCVNDVHNIRQLLVDIFGFPEENIRILTDNEVTKERILTEWKWLTRNARPGDNLVFHFSGHGSYVTDADGDEDDGADELLCLYDMDFGDPNTYLLDDDMRKLTEQVPERVCLTVILDQCHAGTATRLLISPDKSRTGLRSGKLPLVDEQTSRRRSADRGMRSLALSELPEHERVLARFVEPPQDVLDAVFANRIRSRLARESLVSEGQMNHVLWAASRDNQTSADAYIDSDYHGAFTYHFCKAVRQAGPTADHRDVIETIRSTLQQKNFSQEPQLEPRSVRGPLLRWRGNGSGEDSGAPPWKHGVPVGSTEFLRLLGEIRDVLPLLREIRDVLRNGHGHRDSSPATARALVYVHGICHHTDNYADPWWRSLRPHLPNRLQSELERNRHAVLWSDLVNRVRSDAYADALLERHYEEEELAEQIREVLRDRAEHQAGEVYPRFDRHDHSQGQQASVVDRTLLEIPGQTCIDDFVRYLFDSRIRDAIQRRFIDAVVPLLRGGATIDVISHSWGTVVAYEALRRLDGESFRGHVQTLFTAGAAMAIWPVRRRVRPRDGQRPRHVRRWVNLNARGDIVGGPLNDFQVDHEFVGLHPTTCGPAVTASCAHGSYFTSENVAVNRDIFARYIQSSLPQ